MEKVKRKVTFRIYPSTKQANKMVEIMRLHQRLYNAALEQRIDAYRRSGKSLNYYDQAKDLTQLRAEFPEYAALNPQSEQVTLRRLERAFQAFFRRVKAGEKAPGFPRFKAFDRFKGWGYAAHGDGWRFKPNADYVNGTLHLSGIGNLQARGRSRFIDELKSSRIPSILDTSPGKFFALLECKAADAGIPYIEIPTRKVKPSQSCSGCGAVQKKALSERTHACDCGLTLNRDVNAARVILNYALTGCVTGREPSLGVEGGVTRPLKHETLPIPERSCKRA